MKTDPIILIFGFFSHFSDIDFRKNSGLRREYNLIKTYYEPLSAEIIHFYRDPHPLVANDTYLKTKYEILRHKLTGNLSSQILPKFNFVTYNSQLLTRLKIYCAITRLVQSKNIISIPGGTR